MYRVNKSGPCPSHTKPSEPIIVNLEREDSYGRYLPNSAPLIQCLTKLSVVLGSPSDLTLGNFGITEGVISLLLQNCASIVTSF